MNPLFVEFAYVVEPFPFVCLDSVRSEIEADGCVKPNIVKCAKFKSKFAFPLTI